MVPPEVRPSPAGGVDQSGSHCRPNPISPSGRVGSKSRLLSLSYLNDMGIHSPLFPAQDGSSEIDEEALTATTTYSQTLATISTPSS